MSTEIGDVSGTSCAFIPVYCYYDRNNGGEVKTPILIVDNITFLLKAVILDIDPSIFSTDELKDQFLDAYYEQAADTPAKGKSLDPYDIYPQLVTVLHTDDEEISIYVCELYENTEPYFKKNNRSNVAQPVTYKENIDILIKGGALDSLTEKILIALSEDDYITRNDDSDDSHSVELF